MSRIVNLLFPAPTLRRSPLAVVAWWESRRLAYNAIVGTAGVLSLGVVSAVAGAPPLRALVPIAAYGIMANVCFTAGAAIELVVERWLGRPVYGLGPALFRHGLVFSVGLTLLPMAIAPLTLVVRLLNWLT